MGNKFKPGEIVMVLRPLEILKTLDSQGCLNDIPFMPEMIAYCGKKFRVRTRIEKTCVVSKGVRAFSHDDVVYLENLRCDGSGHDGCQIGCMIFWNEAWLRKTDGSNNKKDISTEEKNEVRAKLKTKENKKIYFCQSTQLNKATRKISKLDRMSKLLKEVQTKSVSTGEALKSLVFPVWWRINFKQLSGNLNKTPNEVLNLQPGELVEVKSFDVIQKTLNKGGRNKGLGFHYDMKQYCGKRFRVRNRIEKMISETDGEMKKIDNTVILEDVTCDFAYRFWGCSRGIFQFWREIWLKRVED